MCKMELVVGSFGCVKENIPLASCTISLVTELEQQLMCSPDLIKILNGTNPKQKVDGLANILSSGREPNTMACFFINLWVITVHRHRPVYELGDLFLEKGADINAPFIDSANAVCAAIPVGEMKINRGSSAEIRHVFNY